MKSIPLRGTGRHFTHEYLKKGGENSIRNDSRMKRKEAAVWQRRYWEHTFYDEEDLNTHIDYIHFNPMKHGLVKQVSEWPWSSFHRYVHMGVYLPDWGGSIESDFVDVSMGE